MPINEDDIKGRAKIAAGAVIGDKDLENEGRMDRMAGQAKDQINVAADKAKGLINTGTDKAGDLVDTFKVQASALVDKIKK